MKLTKDTRYKVQIGTQLRSGDTDWIVTNVISSGLRHKGISVTLTDMQTKQNLYAYPLHKCYGMELIDS